MITTIVNYVNENYPRYKNLPKNEYFLKACLTYKYLFEAYFKQTADIYQIPFTLFEGLFDLDLRTTSVILKNHLIFSYAFSKFYQKYRKGGGKIYIMETNMPNSATLGFITGVLYWCFHKGVC